MCVCLFLLHGGVLNRLAHSHSGDQKHSGDRGAGTGGAEGAAAPPVFFCGQL